MAKKAYVPEHYIVKAKVGWLLCLFSYFFEIMLLVLMFLVIVPEGKTANLTVFILYTLPLIPFAPYLLKRGIRAHVWLCFLSLFYFMFAVPSAIDPRYGLLGRIELCNTILLFVATLCFSRWEQRRLGITITPKA